MSAKAVAVNWIDAAGKLAKIVFYVAADIVDPTNAIVTGFVALLQTIAKARAKDITLTAGVGFSGTAADTDYGSVQDFLQLSAVDEANSEHTWKIPTPAVGDFQADGVRYKGDAAGASAFRNAVSTYCVSEDGDSTIVGNWHGYRGDRKKNKI